MKREWLLLAGTACLTLLAALGLLRWLAPHLLGIQTPVDLQVVQLDKAVPAFYDAAIPGTPARGGDSLINDPYTGHRMHALLMENDTARGPIDLLGFRNRSVPVAADVVALGDSQTFGNNATIDAAWPTRIGALLKAKHPVVYNMAVSGWGPVQYLYMFDKALAFRPRVVVVAFYTGNDPVDAIQLAYHHPLWKDLRGSDKAPRLPPSAWPPTPAESWHVRFPDGMDTVLTPKTRLMSNDRAYPGTAEGYRLMAEVGRRIAARGREAGVGVVFTIIPTKETALARKVEAAGLDAPADYRKLVADETANIADLAAVLTALPGARYVDVLRPLQRAATGPDAPYPAGPNGHPTASGYRTIARALAPAVDARLPASPPDGLALVRVPGTEQYEMVLIRNGALWGFGSPELVPRNGWRPDPARLPRLTHRDVAHLVGRGVINEVAPERFGPIGPRPARGPAPGTGGGD